MIIEHVINKILQLDPELIKIMSPLQHKIISVHCQQFPTVTLYALFDLDNISILVNRADLIVDTQISGELTSFLKLLQKDQQVPLSSLDIKVYGDLNAAQNLEIFLKSLNLDWQEYLAKKTNDQISEVSSRILSKSVALLRVQAQSMTMMLADYLNHESNLIANLSSLEEFYTAVDNLRLAVDRFKAKMDHYANH